MLDMFPLDGSDPAENYQTIRNELAAFSPTLAQKHEIIAANKMDLAVDAEALDKLRAALPDKQIIAISGAAHHNLDRLLDRLWRILQS
jgi:GTP-binding protein